jgi:beta-glucosidase-like glycosyl hydrolase
MTGHILVEALDETTPATLSRAALAPLREELGFSGVLMSDGAEMRALDGYSPEQIATGALNATVDLLLPCHEPDFILALYRGIVVGCEREEIAHETLLAAEARVLAWRRRFGAPPPAEGTWRPQLGTAEHQDLAEEIRERAQERG